MAWCVQCQLDQPMLRHAFTGPCPVCGTVGRTHADGTHAPWCRGVEPGALDICAQCRETVFARAVTPEQRAFQVTAEAEGARLAASSFGSQRRLGRGGLVLGIALAVGGFVPPVVFNYRLDHGTFRPANGRGWSDRDSAALDFWLSLLCVPSGLIAGTLPFTVGLVMSVLNRRRRSEAAALSRPVGVAPAIRHELPPSPRPSGVASLLAPGGAQAATAPGGAVVIPLEPPSPAASS